MIKRTAFAVSLSVAVILCLSTHSVARADVSSNIVSQDPAPPTGKVLNEFRKIRLDMDRNQVREILGKPSESTDASEDYKLDGDDLLTVHYNNDKVKAIQIAFFDVKNVPDWREVVGDAEINQSDSGARHARKVLMAENFWVSMWQNKDASMTRITISH